VTGITCRWRRRHVSLLPGTVDASHEGQTVPEAAMREPWESNEKEMQWADPEAWRGEQHPETPEDWCPDASADSMWAGEAEIEDNTADETPGWPEELAGPEYWMYRRLGG
jgi:hypothetical protein